MKKYSMLLLALAMALCASAQVTIEGEGLYLIPDKDDYKGYHQPEQTSFYLEYGQTYYFQVDSDYFVTVTGVDLPDLKIAQAGNSVFLFFDWDGLLKKYNMNQSSDFALPGCNSFKMASGIYSVEALDPDLVGDAGNLNFGYLGSIQDYCGFYNDIAVRIRYTTKKRVQVSSTTYSNGPWVFSSRSRTYYETRKTNEDFIASSKLAKVLGYGDGCYAFFINKISSSDDQMTVHVGDNDYKVDWEAAMNGWVTESGSMGLYSDSPVPAHTGNVILIIYDSNTLKYHMQTMTYGGTIGDFITSVRPINAQKAESGQTYSVSGIPGAQEGLIIKNGKTYYVK
ncbi:MAG: hypothetical protein IKJ66_05925 [Bacteroidaceae bacterium]|nr:hypothetical protein [Bacteroidaceae bacterium]